MNRKSLISYSEDDFKSYDNDDIDYDTDLDEDIDGDEDHNNNRIPISLNDFLNPNIKQNKISNDNNINNYDNLPDYELKLKQTFSKENNNLELDTKEELDNDNKEFEIDLRPKIKEFKPCVNIPLVNPLVNSCLKFEFTEYNELWFHLFTFLPINIRAKFMTVCRLWFRLLTYSSHSNISWRKLYMEKSKIGNEFSSLYTHGREWSQAYGYLGQVENIKQRNFQVLEYSQPDKIGGSITQIEYENGLIAAVNKFCNQILIFDASNGTPDSPSYVYAVPYLEMHDICLNERSIVSCYSYSQTSTINFETFEIDLFNESNNLTKFTVKSKLSIIIAPFKITRKLIVKNASIHSEPIKFNKILSIVKFVTLFKKEGLLPDLSRIITGHENGEVCFWNPDGSLEASIRPTYVAHHSGNEYKFHRSKNERFLLRICNKNMMHIIDLNTQTLSKPFKPDEKGLNIIHCASFADKIVLTTHVKDNPLIAFNIIAAERAVVIPAGCGTYNFKIENDAGLLLIPDDHRNGAINMVNLRSFPPQRIVVLYDHDLLNHRIFDISFNRYFIAFVTSINTLYIRLFGIEKSILIDDNFGKIYSVLVHNGIIIIGGENNKVILLNLYQKYNGYEKFNSKAIKGPSSIKKKVVVQKGLNLGEVKVRKLVSKVKGK